MYRILGADGRQYGPVNAEQLRRWIAEGRANAQTQTLADGATDWKPLGTFSEFSGHFPAQPPPTLPFTTGHPRITSGFATWGMIFGILAVICCCPKILFGVLGLIFSLIGLSQINEQPDYYKGRGLAIAGIVLSILGILFAVLCWIIFAANPGHYHIPYHRYY